jgi:2-keto-4-pentenoate hydratase/2-oxohepta-3-ene-1,7-dioic acid hydratase in catechol pathway
LRLTRARLGEHVVLGRLEGDELVVLAQESVRPGADVLREALADAVDLSGPGHRVPLADVSLLSPVSQPSKIICVGLNYAEHARESGETAPTAPVLFNKMPSAVVGPDQDIVVNADLSAQLDYEAELVVVIGKRVHRVSPEDALGAVLGYTAGNDVSARDAQFADGQWLRGKSFDTASPLGPVIVTADEIPDPQDLRVVCRVNGEVRQDDSTSQMVHSVAALIAYASAFFTLEPGDVIFTGTPEGVGFARTPPVYLVDGDKVEVEIERIGTLTNTVSIASSSSSTSAKGSAA